MLQFVKDNDDIIDVRFTPSQTNAERANISTFELVVNTVKPPKVIKHFAVGVIYDNQISQIDKIEEYYTELLKKNTTQKTIPNSNIEKTVIDLVNINDDIQKLESQYPHLKKFRQTKIYDFTINITNFTNDQLKQLLIQYCKLWAKKKIAAFILKKPEAEITKEDIERSIIKQMNYQADGANLVFKIAQGKTLTNEEQQYLDDLRAGKQIIDQIRQKSNEIEKLIKNTNTVDDLLLALDQLEQFTID